MLALGKVPTMDWCSKRDCLRWTLAVSARVLLWMTLSAAPAMAAVQPLGDIDFSPATAQSPATVVMSIPERPEFKVFALDGPPRLVVDLANTRLGNGIDPLALATLADAAPLRGIRIAPRGDSLRVVIDLAQPQAHRVQWRVAKGGAKPRLEVLLGLPRADRTVAVVESPRGPASTVASEPKAVAAVPDGIASPSAGTASPASPVLPVSAGTTVASEPPVVRAAPVAVEAVPSPVAPVRNKVPTGGRDLVVAIDAGHGGKDPGAVGAKGTREKDVTLAIARRLAAAIDAEPGLRAYLVRDGDYFIDLRQRMVKARKAGADLFLSIHADSAPNRAAAGSSIYILSTRGASSEAARWLADRENAADLAGGVALDRVDPTVASVLMDLSQGDTITTSDRAARRVLDELDRIGNIHKREVQSAGFMVLKSPDIPSMLVETAFISHPAEEERLGNPDHQQRLATAIHAGVRAFFHANPPPGSRIAQIVAAGRGSSRIAAAVR